MKYLFFSSLLIVQLSTLAQESTVEKSVAGIQTGFLGAWVHYETYLASATSLRAEAGMDLGIWGGSFWPKTGYILVPVLTLEPRLYYNLAERALKSKKTINNSANFVAIKTSYHPNALLISNYQNPEIISDLSIIPTWGIRRHIGQHISFETGIGIGYRVLFTRSFGYEENYKEVAANLHLRVGYTF